MLHFLCHQCLPFTRIIRKRLALSVYFTHTVVIFDNLQGFAFFSAMPVAAIQDLVADEFSRYVNNVVLVSPLSYYYTIPILRCDVIFLTLPL